MSVERLIGATEQALAQQNWYAALIVALTLPDICAKLEEPVGQSGPRYQAWWERFMQRHYQSMMPTLTGRELFQFMAPGDAYALRCAILHEGREEISEQRARAALERFQFVPPPRNGRMHCNSNGVKLQLQVDIYCEQICQGVREWREAVAGQPQVLEREAELIEIIPDYRF